jgi:hypothetical protein
LNSAKQNVGHFPSGEEKKVPDDGAPPEKDE